MIFDIKLNGVIVQKDVPTDWSQVKFKDFIQLQDNKELTALSVFTGIDPETLKKSNITGLEKLLNIISFVETEVPLFKYPKTILNYEIRQDLEFEAFGQYTDLKEEIEKGKTGIELIKQYPLMCAIYTTKPYDFKVAEQREQEFLEAPCTEVLACGNFLLMKLIALKVSTAKASLHRLTVLRRLKLVLKGWLARLAFQARYFILKRKLNIR